MKWPTKYCGKSEANGGYGFNITDARGRPLALFAYEKQTKAIAEVTHARALIRKAVSVRALR